MEEVYQYSLKVEEIFTKKHEQRQRGKGGIFQRGRGRSYGEIGRSKNYVQDKHKSKCKTEDKDKTEWRGGNSYRGGTSSYSGRGNSYPRGGFQGTYFRCGKEGHRSFELKKSSKSKSSNRNFVVQGESEDPMSGPEAGANLMVRRTLCSKEANNEPILRRSILI